MSKTLSNIAESVLMTLCRIEKFQSFVNRHAILQYGMSFIYHSNNSTIHECFKDYDFSGLSADDVVLDIGANVGGFSLFVSRIVKRVYSVEPVMFDTLLKNILKNNIHNITVLKDPLGNEINWNIKKSVSGKTLTELRSLCDDEITVLKCDCEGGEWYINPNEFKGIRKIMMEVHPKFLGGTDVLDVSDYRKILLKLGYELKSKENRNVIIATKQCG